MKRERICGIYFIKNKVNNFLYLGLSINVYHRISVHVSALRKGYEENQYLQNSWNKYGEKNFETGIIEVCSPEILLKREIFWIKKLKTIRPSGYNISSGGNVPPSNKGTFFSKEHRSKISMALMGNKNGKSQKGIKRPGKNKYIGVGYDKKANTWHCSIILKNGKQSVKGGFLTEKDGAIGRDYLLWKEYGINQIFEFPENIKNNKYVGKFNTSEYSKKYNRRKKSWDK